MRHPLGAGFVLDATPVNVWKSYANFHDERFNRANAAHSIYFQMLGDHGFGGLFLFLLLGHLLLFHCGGLCLLLFPLFLAGQLFLLAELRCFFPRLAGGIGLAPIRPALYHVLLHRALYGRVVLLYGARTPRDMLFPKELREWRSRFDVVVDVRRSSPTYGQWEGVELSSSPTVTSVGPAFSIVIGIVPEAPDTVMDPLETTVTDSSSPSTWSVTRPVSSVLAPG
jgi:hypothetical protein